MKLILTTTLMIIISAYCFAETNTCKIPGESIHWIVDYCMYKSETDDFLNDSVQACFNSQKSNGLSECEIKEKYKEKICNLLKSDSNKSFEKCMKDENFSGPTVRNGGI